jgi:hypothetical protein
VWQHAATESRRTLVGSERVSFGLAAVEGCHREGMTEDNGNTRRGAEGSEPVPGAAAFDGHNQTGPSGRTGVQKRCRSRLHVAVQQDGILVAQDADVHTPGMQGDTTVKGVRIGVAAHGGLLRVRAWLFPKASRPPGSAAGEAAIIIKGMQATALTMIHISDRKQRLRAS